MTKSYCVQCKKEVNNDVHQCECGSRTFIYGEKIEIEHESIVCRCGNDKMQFVSHLDYSDRAITTYKCNGCNSVIGTESWRSEKGLAYWEE